MSTPTSQQAERYQLFQRSGSTRWQMRFSIKGQGQIKRSLETDDQAEAQRRADAIWYKATYRAEQGLSAKAHGFEAVADEYIKLIHREVERGERRADQGRSEPSLIRRFFVGYFAQKPIDTINETDLERYAEWRRTYWTEGPGKLVTHIEYERAGHRLKRPVRRVAPAVSRQRAEMVVLRALLRQAVKWGYLKTPPEIRITARRAPDNRRPSFEPHEFAKLEATSLSRLADPVMNDGPRRHVKSKNGRSGWSIKRLDDHTRRDRTLMHAYVMIGAFSGLRPTEMYNLTWGDVLGYRAGRHKPVDQRDIRLQVRGKGKSGKAIPQKAAIPWFDTLWMLFQRSMAREPLDTDPVFASEQGKRVSSVANGFTQLLKAAGLERDHRGIKRTPYSLRHFHISEQLANGAEVMDVARNCRTSLVMIDKHYGQVRLERVADRLRPEWTRA
ncbi:integrase [Methylobacterium sp. Leaf87]|uniref:tyrosine-type recombinase/integrase n=1 Tax=Methylobacterium sp. Leaf87 TaxID=1736243 RepID=UPI0007018908|nr:site-specific integrase [Methylobacterium sp. Leaf87]KQO64090.1 integrase [Methylobacterium sp. Leaf87]